MILSKGSKIMLKPEGVLTLEFPHLLKLIELNEFDTIYHEHFSYFSLLSTVKIMEAHGLRVFDVEELKSHGGSLRVYACRAESRTHRARPNVSESACRGEKGRLGSADGYERFARKVKETKFALVDFCSRRSERAKQLRVTELRARARHLLHYCGIGKDLIEYTVDRSPYKQGRFLPGTHIPIYHPDRILRNKARLCGDSPLEFERRNHAAVEVHPGVGRQVCRADPESRRLLAEQCRR